MTYQLEYFKQYISRLKRLVGEEKAKFIVTNSLYLVSLGSNDLAITYYIPHPRLVQYDISSYTNLLTRRAAKLVQVTFLFSNLVNDNVSVLRFCVYMPIIMNQTDQRGVYWPVSVLE